MGDPLLQAFAHEACAFFQSQPVHECLSESSKLLLLDSQVSLSVAVKALDQYKRPFACVFAPRVPEFTYVFDAFDVVAFAIHVYKYYTDTQYLGQLHDALCSVIQNSNTFGDYLCLVEGDGEPITEEVKENLVRDLDTTLGSLADTFSLRDFEKEEPYLGQPYSGLFATGGGRTTVDTAAEEEDKDAMKTPIHAVFSSTEDRTTATTINTDITPDDSGDPHALSIRRRIELIFPPPWAYDLERWNKLNARVSALPHLSIVHTALDAVKLLLESERSRVIVWDDARATPFSFLTTTSLLAHMVQHFRSRSDVLDRKVLSELRVGVSYSDLIVASHTTKFVKVLEILRGRRWSAVPIVDADDGSFIGLLSVSHVTFLVLRSLSDSEMKWHWDDEVGDIWEVLVSTGAAHSKMVRHTYAHTLRKQDKTARPPEGPQPPPAGTSSRRAITSKHGGAFLAKLGDMTEEKQEKATDGGGTAGDESKCSDLPALVEPLEALETPPLSPSDSQHANANPTSATSAVQNLVKNITCSAMVMDEDMTLRQAIAHLVLTDDRRIVFVDPDTGRIKGYITPSQIMSLLIRVSNPAN